MTVSYNAPDLIEALLRTLRQFYTNRVYIIDGSNPDIAEKIRTIAAPYDNVEFIAFGYNIHHGPGMAWAIENLGLMGEVLFLDSDVEIVNAGFIEALHSELEPGMYGVGSTQPVNEQGYDREDGIITYLHPACILANVDVMRQWPLPIKHGAPMIAAMLALHRSGNTHLYKHIQWLRDDVEGHKTSHYITHPWQGTVIRTGGYHYDLPTATKVINTDLLQFVPMAARKLGEVGCSDGADRKSVV